MEKRSNENADERKLRGDSIKGKGGRGVKLYEVCVGEDLEAGRLANRGGEKQADQPTV